MLRQLKQKKVQLRNTDEVTDSEPDSEDTDSETTVTYNPRSGPYKLRPNPNPNYSDLYRY